MVLVAVLLASLPRLDLGGLAGAPPAELNDLLRATAWLTLGYAGLEVILANRRQVRDPARLLPRALPASLLGGCLLLASVLLLAVFMRTPEASTEATALAERVATAGWLPGGIVAGLGVVVSLLAAGLCLMAGARQFHAMSRQGALPNALRRLVRRLRLPPLLLAILFVMVAPLTFWLPIPMLVDIAACLFLLTALLVNAAAINSRRTEPDRRRWFTVPFHPLVPAVAMALNGGLLFTLSRVGFVGGAIWLLLGMVVFFSYARTHQRVAQEGVLVFTREPLHAKKEGTCRILVPLSEGQERRFTLRLATVLASQMGGEVLPLQVIPAADPLAIEEGRRIASERNTLFQWSLRLAGRSGVPTIPITRLARSVSEGVLDTAIEDKCDLILMSWQLKETGRGARMGQTLDAVVRRAPCDVAVVAYRQDQVKPKEDTAPDPIQESAEAAPGVKIGRILVPTSGGPHAPLATQLAALFAREYDATTTAVYVVDPAASSQELAEGQGRIAQTLEAFREQAANLPGAEAAADTLAVESRVVRAKSVVEGIAEAGADNDLVLIGASEEDLIDQVLFGTVPEQVAQASPAPVVMVKRYRGLRRFWLRRIWETLYRALPKLTREEQVAIYKQVRRDAQPDVDFFIMIGLSAIIATFGLLQNSSAVIIGAMLVAPLFTPILALSLAFVQADIRLIRNAVESTLKGTALAVGLGVLITLLSPLDAITPEIIARAYPNLFDLAVALTSGAAGAYAIARKDVAASLPGVAIAAALVPPLGVVGVGLAAGDLQVARGGSLLFTTNLLAIVLSGAVTLVLLGFRPFRRQERGRQFRWGIAISVVLLVAISIPLAAVFVGSVQESRIRLKVDQTLTAYTDLNPNLELVDFDIQDGRPAVEVTATLYISGETPPQIADALSSRLTDSLGKPVRLHLVGIPVLEMEPSP
jgi:uncharacterized hydrophobic protein (TIGR00271 family)